MSTWNVGRVADELKYMWNGSEDSERRRMLAAAKIEFDAKLVSKGWADLPVLVQAKMLDALNFFTYISIRGTWYPIGGRTTTIEAARQSVQGTNGENYQIAAVLGRAVHVVESGKIGDLKKRLQA